MLNKNIQNFDKVYRDTNPNYINKANPKIIGYISKYLSNKTYVEHIKFDKYNQLKNIGIINLNNNQTDKNQTDKNSVHKIVVNNDLIFVDDERYISVYDKKSKLCIKKYDVPLIAMVEDTIIYSFTVIGNKIHIVGEMCDENKRCGAMGAIVDITTDEISKSLILWDSSIYFDIHSNYCDEIVIHELPFKYGQAPAVLSFKSSTENVNMNINPDFLGNIVGVDINDNVIVNSRKAECSFIASVNKNGQVINLCKTDSRYLYKLFDKLVDYEYKPEGSRMNIYSFPNNFSKNSTNVIFPDLRSITNDKCNQYDKIKFERSIDFDFHIIDITFDSDGNIYLLTSDSIYIYNF